MSRPLGAGRAMAVLTAAELRQTARRGENVLVTLIVPPAVLAFFATAGIVPGIAGPAVTFLLPGALALAVIASGLVNLGIATAYERSYGVLKRLGGAPITRATLVAAKVVAVLALEIVQVVVILAVALALGWRVPGGVSVTLVVAALALGTLAFAGLGLLLAGTLRAEAVLALANGLFLGFLMVGGIVLPVDHLPGPIQGLAELLPAWGLSELLRVGLGSGGDVVRPALVLAIWGFGAASLATRWFRWE